MSKAAVVEIKGTPPNGNEQPEALAAAEEAGLRYVSDQTPGIVRRRAGRGFSYMAADGTRLQDPEAIVRIRALAIPPAWTDVWICPHPRGHLQATGRDTRGRKQYRYHTGWRAVRDETKYSRLPSFAKALPQIREQVKHDLSLRGIPRDKVLATVIRLLEMTLIRVGNKEYARDNDSFGLTTMRDRHVEVHGSKLEFEFRGKGGKRHVVDIRDPRLAKIVRQCQEIPGHELFQYVDEDGRRGRVESADVNEYLRRHAGEDFTAKDFRTWAGTVLMVRALEEMGPATSTRQAKRKLLRAIEAVAAMLGNTPAICRAYYVHPSITEGFMDGSLHGFLERRSKKRRSRRGLSGEETDVLAFLTNRRRLPRNSQRVVASPGRSDSRTSARGKSVAWT
ncbi:MAG TPA: DNA topoisomerase IB [Actinomycetota bacterium]|nr:DNA topoisomerase IB [Actinomycetota bacterium]